MSLVWSLALLSLLGSLSVTQSRPRDRSHGGHINDKTVPFVDKPYESGAMFGEYWNHLGNSDTPNFPKVTSKYDELYDRYNKEHNRVIGDGGEGDSKNEDKDAISDAKEDATEKEEKDVSDLPVEGGEDDIATVRKDNVKVKETKDEGQRKHRRHREKAQGRKHGKKGKKGEKNKKKKGQETSSELEEATFDFEKYFKQHPDFQKNVATISDIPEDKKETKPEADTENTAPEEKVAKSLPGEENEVGDNDNEHIDDDLSDDLSDEKTDEMKDKEKAKAAEDQGKLQADQLWTDGKDGQDSESHDLSSEAYKDYYDYYDEEGDSSYSSSEIEAEKNAQAPYDLFQKFEKMYGDQPQAESNADNTAEEDEDDKKEKEAVEKKSTVSEPTAKDVLTEMTSKPTSMPKTDIAPSTSPNPPTPKKYVKSAVTQPVNPQWKRRTDTWNYIESKPVEACKETSDCTAGRMCKFGLCLCGQPDFCDGHSKPVCGSDGQLYPSHCELHRTACVLGIHIRIDYTSRCITPDETGIMSSQISKAADLGSHQILDCKVDLPDNVETGYVLQWEKDDLDGFVYLQYAGFPPHVHDSYSGRVQLINGFSLEVSDIVAQDEGWYQCQLILFDDFSKGNSSWVYLTVHKEIKPDLPIDDESASDDKDNSKHEALSTEKPTAADSDSAAAETTLDSEATDVDKDLSDADTMVTDASTTNEQADDKVTTEASIGEISIETVVLKDEAIAGGVGTKVGKDVTLDQVDLPDKQTDTADDNKSTKDTVLVDEVVGTAESDDFSVEDDSDEDEDEDDEEDEDDMSLDDIDWDDTDIYDDYLDSEELDLSDEDYDDEEYDEDDEDNSNADEDDSMEATTDKPSLVPLFCTPDLYMKFKADVLQYHCIYFEEKNCDRQTAEDKQRLAAVMFNYFDRNFNGRVEKEELWEMQLLESINELSSLCTLLDIITFDELGVHDGKLSSDEFIQAFDIPDLLEHRTELVPLLATVGNGLEVKCDVTESNDIIWKRHAMDLAVVNFPGITVLDDGSLYIETIGFQHVGNLTCHDRKKPSIKQIHMLTVQKSPHVTVAPKSPMTIEGRNLKIHCHIEGFPAPTIEWHFDDMLVEHGTKYHIQNSDNSLTVIHVELEDAGQYKCVAHNRAGTAEGVATVNVHRKNVTTNQVADLEETFVIFHDDGYTMHEPNECLTQRHVKPDFGNFFFIPDELDAPPALCEEGKACSWGGAVNVKDRFVYASQPRQNRIVVIDVQDTFNPNQVIFTDHMPVSLHYVAHLDEVWVLCWNGEEDNGSKTVIIIRNASQKTQHHAVHTQPIGNRFDLVQEVYLPGDSELHHPYKFGYTVHNGQQGLFKVDLVQKKYLKAVDFTSYDCVPKTLAFVPLGGHVLVQCIQKTLQGDVNLILELDYVTDTVTNNMTMPGTPYISPDSNNVVIVNEDTGKVTVYQVLEDGQIAHQFEVTVGSAVSDVTFHKAGFSQGYELYMTSSDSPVLYSVSLLNGKVDTVRDIGEPDASVLQPWFRKSRPLVSGDVFSDYLATTATSSMVIVNGKHHNIQCDFRDLENPAVITFSYLNKD